MKLRGNVLFGVLGFTLTILPLFAGTDSKDMIVHEWGTFTSLQDENGNAIGGINTDDEPVPKFVHRISPYALLHPDGAPPVFFQGAPHCHPDVTMRLETPVLYFHPSPGNPTASDVNVSATFRGGWLTEFYPDAVADAPGVKSQGFRFGHLRTNTIGTLAWNDLKIGGDWSGPETSNHVWTAPREVNAASVKIANDEAEKFLFYRGVAHINAPIGISRKDTLVLRSQCPDELGHELKVNSLWLVDIATNGAVAFKVLPPVTLDGEGRLLSKASDDFAANDYSAANRDKLKASLKAVLIKEGLFDDEAQALLNTWELSYFKSAGERLFFIVPRAWTDFYLPLKLPVKADVTRVMVGRIELVTAKQKHLLQQIAQAPVSDFKVNMDVMNAIREAPERLPKSFQQYLALGRFRNALVLEEEKRHPTPGLSAFIEAYHLEGYQPVD